MRALPELFAATQVSSPLALCFLLPSSITRARFFSFRGSVSCLGGNRDLQSCWKNLLHTQEREPLPWVLEEEDA